MPSFVVKGKLYYWFFNAPNGNEAKITALEILSNESLFSKKSPSEEGQKMSFFSQKMGYCESIGMNLEDAERKTAKEKIQVVVF